MKKLTKFHTRKKAEPFWGCKVKGVICGSCLSFDVPNFSNPGARIRCNRLIVVPLLIENWNSPKTSKWTCTVWISSLKRLIHLMPNFKTMHRLHQQFFAWPWWLVCYGFSSNDQTIFNELAMIILDFLQHLTITTLSSYLTIYCINLQQNIGTPVHYMQFS